MSRKMELFINQGKFVKTRFVTICWVVGAMLGCSTGAGEDKGLPKPVIFVKDSAVTRAVKSKLAIEHTAGVVSIHVETDKDGVVWLSGSVRTQKTADEIAATARATEHVTAVYNDLKINKSARSSG